MEAGALMADAQLTQRCTIDGCEKQLRCQGWCEMHYSRWRRNGSPHIASTRAPKRPPAVERWRARIEQRADGCWEWTASRYSNGYGRFREPITRRQCLAHRWGYEQFIGPVPDDLELDHLCRNKACVNPDHLEPVTHAENVRRWQITLVKPTHCRNGHEYTSDNCLWHASVRRCRTCSQINDRKRRGKTAAPREFYEALAEVVKQEAR